MPPSPWDALADALEVLAQTLRALPLVSPSASTLPPSQPLDKWLTVRQFSERHPAFPRGTVSALVSARTANGLEGQGIAKKVLGRKVIVHEARLLAWLLHEPVPQSGHLMTPPKQGRRSQD